MNPPTNSIGALALLVSLGACSETLDATDAGSDGGVLLDAALDASTDASSEDAGVPNEDAGLPERCRDTDATETALPSGMEAAHRNGQTFVTWSDRQPGEAGANIRYRLYRANQPIDAINLGDAELIAGNILNNSAQLFGSAFVPAQRLDPEAPMAFLEEGGEPLPLWSGLGVATTLRGGCAYYAVLATDVDGAPIEEIEAGVNATVNPIAELAGPKAPVLRYASDDRGIYAPQTRITGTPGLPLRVELHASSAQGGGAGEYGDYYSYFGDASMGYRDGLGGVFSVQETHSGPQFLRMRHRDTIVRPDGSRGMETHWFGYVATDPISGESHAYPYTEARLDWMIPWAIGRYAADPERIYASGGSMGAWGTMTYAFRRPELFAAVYPDRPRFVQTNLVGIDRSFDEDTIALPDGTPWTAHRDAIAFVRSHPGDLPFVGWNNGRRDGFATWQEQLDMVAALEEMHHGFAFAWNNGDHSSGSQAREIIQRWYPQELFARNQSYPAFSHSSINDDLGGGDPEDGDLEGGINLGFVWEVTQDTEAGWHLLLRNELAEAPMNVSVTPRRLQDFAVAPNASFGVTMLRAHALPEALDARSDDHGVLTIDGVILDPDADTELRITAAP